MKKNIVLRDAHTDDLASIEGLLAASYAEFEDELPRQVWTDWRESMHESLHSGKGCLIVGEVDGRIVAFVQFFPEASVSRMEKWPAGSACMRMLCVSPECRRNGYGELLIKECLRRAAELHIPALFLQTGRTMSAAHGLYRKLGFKPDPRYNEYLYGPDDHTIAYRYDLKTAIARPFSGCRSLSG